MPFEKILCSLRKLLCSLIEKVYKKMLHTSGGDVNVSHSSALRQENGFESSFNMIRGVSENCNDGPSTNSGHDFDCIRC